jgi:hypothetical protein
MDAGDVTAFYDNFFEVLSDDPAEDPVPEITPEAIRRKRCACCGLPARVSVHDLKARRRTLLCEACRPPVRLSATVVPGSK